MTDQPQSPELHPGDYRWFGLVMFVGGLAVFNEWDVSSWRDWYPSRLGFLCAIIGAVIYFEGLAAKVMATVRRHRSS